MIRRVEPELTRAEQIPWLNRLHRELDNLRSALEWGLAAPERAQESVELVAALWWFWIKRGYYREGQESIERALSAGGDAPPAVRARALVGLGALTFFQGDFIRARAVFDETATLARAAGDLGVVGFARGLSAMAALEQGDIAACVREAAEGLEAGSASTAPWVKGLALSCLAYVAMIEGDLERAGRLHEDVLELGRQQGDKWGIGIVLFDLALLRVVQQRYAEARTLCAEGIALCHEFRDRRGIAWCLGILSGAEAAEGQVLRAALLRGAMEGLLESVGAPPQPSYHQWIGDRALAAMAASLGQPALDEALAGGRAMSLARAIEVSQEAAVT
jgi:tetratricopeptide (TPR) repeat protein